MCCAVKCLGCLRIEEELKLVGVVGYNILVSSSYCNSLFLFPLVIALRSIVVFKNFFRDAGVLESKLVCGYLKLLTADVYST